jgi:hypothetical protein
MDMTFQMQALTEPRASRAERVARDLSRATPRGLPDCELTMSVGLSNLMSDVILFINSYVHKYMEIKFLLTMLDIRNTRTQLYLMVTGRPMSGRDQRSYPLPPP